MPKCITSGPAGIPNDLGAPRLPGSKSHAQRAMLLASFLPGRTDFGGVPASDDLAVLLRALAARGVRITSLGGGRWVVDGVPPQRGERLRIDAGENATVARMLLSMLPLLGGEITVDGEPGLRRRPMAAVTAMLRDAGIACVSDRLPIHADGRGVAPADLVRVDASTSSQPASGALLAVALRGGGVVEVASPAALGYVDLTAQVLRSFGALVIRQPEPWGVVYELSPPGTGPRQFQVPIDPSARAFVAVLAAMHGHALPTSLLPPPHDAHPDWGIDADIAALRAAGESDVVLAGQEARPDSVPALAMLAALRRGRTTFRGVANLRGKESDRLAALATALGALAVEARVTADALEVIGPVPQHRQRVAVPTVRDHRIVMAVALLGTVLSHGIELQNTEAVAKSWPEFWTWLGRCATVG